VFTSDFETYRQNGALTLPDAYQITASNLHPDFIAAFTAFASNPGAINPVQGDYNYFITDDKVKAYKQFLDTWGTHVLIKVIVGRKYARHYSTADNTTNVQELMRARACAEASASFGTNSGTLQGCYGVTEEDIKNSYSLDVHENTYAWGGGQYGTELAALAQGNNCPPSGNLLIDFLSSPKNEDVAIAWEFKPIWDILAKMTTLSLEQKRCAEMLKLVFDYFMVNEALGFDNCTVQRIPASNGTIVRGVKVKNWNGTDPEFACWHVPNGCDSDAACRWRATGVRDNNQAECTAENGGQCYAWDALQKKVIQAPYQKNGGCEPKGPGDCPWYWKPCWGDWNHEANCRNNAQPGWESYTELSCINPAAGCGYIK
jgi:hypothetical protein